MAPVFLLSIAILNTGSGKIDAQLNSVGCIIRINDAQNDNQDMAKLRRAIWGQEAP
jgi:hypothetical protein